MITKFVIQQATPCLNFKTSWRWGNFTDQFLMKNCGYTSATYNCLVINGTGKTAISHQQLTGQISPSPKTNQQVKHFAAFSNKVLNSCPQNM